MDRSWFPRWHPYFRLAVKFEVEPEDEIGPQLRALGVEPDDVRTVVMTHLHGDHAGGIPHFPRSEFVVARGEYEATKGFAGQSSPATCRSTSRSGSTRRSSTSRTGPATRSRRASGSSRPPATRRTTCRSIVDDGERTLFIAGDVAYREDLLRAGVADGVTESPETHRATLAKIRAFVDEHDAVFLPSHDPESAARLGVRSLARHARPAAPLAAAALGFGAVAHRGWGSERLPQGW